MSKSPKEDYDETEERAFWKSDMQDLAKFLDSLQPRMLNLMNEFADAEMFLIDGDSLLMELALDKNLDWNYSGQLLHLVYLFERYLHLFVRRDGVFHIVFFKNFDEVWKSKPCIYLARKVIIQHLTTNVDCKVWSNVSVNFEKVLYQFESPWDWKFVEHMKEFMPSFMLLSDGEILFERSDQRLIPEHVSKIFILHFLKVLSLEMNCAFSYGVEFGPSSLNGFHIMSSPEFRNWAVPTPWPVETPKLNEFSACRDVACLPKVIDDALTKLKDRPASFKFNVACRDKDDAIDCRLILHVVTVSVYLKLFLTPENQDFQHDLVRVLLLHGVLLTQLPLKCRAFSMSESDSLLTNLAAYNQVKESLEKLQFIMAKFLESDEFLQGNDLLWSGICDTWDGRLFYQVLILLLKSKQNGSEPLLFDKSTKEKFESLVEDVSTLLDCEKKLKASPILSHLGNDEMQYLLKKKQGGTQAAVKEKDGLIQIECSLLNEYAGDILKNTSVKKLNINNQDVVSENILDKTYHWHSGKPLSDEFYRTKDSNSEISGKRASLKSQDNYAKFMHRYGQSLQDGANYKPIIVEKANQNNRKEKNKTSKKCLEMQKENAMKNEKTKLKKAEDSWLNIQRQVKQYEDQMEYGFALNILNRCTPGEMGEKTRNAILLTKARILWKKWKEYCQANPDHRDETDAEELFLTIKELLQSNKEALEKTDREAVDETEREAPKKKDKEALSKKDKDTLAEYLYGLGFNDIVLKTNLTKKSYESSDEYKLIISSLRFQLRNIGAQLKRVARTDQDSRVEYFIPETWQRELLDAVDNKQSALIVAPTSSGKTFASYYCMEQVLKKDHEGVVVYVSPTKALVNQVAATCCARYKKKMPPGKSVYGVFTRDYRQNAETCQILVTVPQCLEILLLSPARQDWVARIQYVVFDEVHCIGLEIGAEVWEHLLLLIRCPFLALSATIRNPEVLHEWLQNAENDKFERDKINNTLRPNSPKSYEVALVTHNERYNDLEKFNYPPPKEGQSMSKIEHIHPCSVLTTRQLKQSDTFPEDVSLSPRETLAFYDAIKSAFTNEELWETLSPEMYFKGETFITKQDVRSYEKELKNEFMTYVKNNDKRVEKVIENLRSQRTENWSFPNNSQNDFLTSHIFSLIEELQKSDQLPVIFFSFDRRLCIKFANKLISCLEQREARLGFNTKREEKVKQKEAKAEKRQRDQEEVERHEKMRKAVAAGHDDFSHQQSKTTAKASCFLVDDPPPDSCSFAGKGVLDAADAQVIVGRLEKWGEKSNDRDERFKEGLRRGLSYHHAGMSARQRSVVEMLFRKKFVRVVFATGTLALGIHMPCKTVVFAKDSVFLNTLQYHQISGRAGRRGYDQIGHVIFFGIPKPKIQRLMTVRLPRIIGNFPLNVSLVLRLLHLVSNVENREIAMMQALTLLENPLICKSHKELGFQLKHHFLFSVDWLVRQGLVDRKGRPKGLASLANHLHYHEPANFIFVTFLCDGLLDDFCCDARSGDGNFSEDFLKSLVVLLSHLFARRKLHKMLLRRQRSTSRVVLDKLPSKFKDCLVQYNDKVHGVFDLYLRTVAADTTEEDITLPLSRSKLISSENCQINPLALTLDDKLQSLAQPYKAISAFAALSGHTDNQQYCIQDLISNIRYQVYTDVKVVPTLEVDVDLNAYAYDFFNHGNHKALIQENGILEGEAFNLLKDFMLVLQSISLSLTELGTKYDDNVVAAFTQLNKEFESLLYPATTTNSSLQLKKGMRSLSSSSEQHCSMTESSASTNSSVLRSVLLGKKITSRQLSSEQSSMISMTDSSGYFSMASFPEADHIAKMFTVDGGTIETVDITLKAGQGCLAENTDVIMKRADHQFVVSKSLLNLGLVHAAPRVIKFSPDGLEFSKPLDLTIKFKNDDLDSECFILHGFYNPIYERIIWEVVTNGVEVNDAEGVIHVKINSFSLYMFITSTHTFLARILCHINQSFICLAYCLYRRSPSMNTIDIAVVLVSEFFDENKENNIKHLLAEGFAKGEKGVL